MSRPNDPPREDDPGVSMPPWDDPIAGSRSKGIGGGPGEIAATSSESAGLAAGSAGPGQHPLVGAMSPRDAARRAALPWIAAALIVGGLALVVCYIIFTRPPE